MSSLLLLLLLMLNAFTPSGLPLDVAQSLAKQYAPLLKMHPDDASSPVSVDWYLPRVSLNVRNSKTGKTLQTLVSRGNLNDDVLGNYEEPPSGFEHYLDPEGDEETYAGEGYTNYVSEAPCYVNIVNRPNDAGIRLQYMYLYGKQGPEAFGPLSLKWIGEHNFDAEHIDVYLNKKIVNNATLYYLYQVFYARHSRAHGDLVKADQLELIAGHPVSYVAENDHGNYPHNVFLSSDFDHTSDSGPLWPCKNPIIVGTKENPQPGQKWINFNGRWGDTQDGYFHGSSSTTITFNDWFISPGQTGSPVDIDFINGTEIDEIQINNALIDETKGSMRYSDFYTLKMPADASRIQWLLKSPNQQSPSPSVSFDLFQMDIYPFTEQGMVVTTHTPILKGLTPNAITALPTASKNVYIANVQGTTEALKLRLFTVDE